MSSQKLRVAGVSRFISYWNQVPMGPPDPIIGLNEAYAKDDFPQKVNIGVGAYRDDNGKAYVLPCGKTYLCHV